MRVLTALLAAPLHTKTTGAKEKTLSTRSKGRPFFFHLGLRPKQGPQTAAAAPTPVKIGAILNNCYRN
jgi:hypothetical protein